MTKKLAGVAITLILVLTAGCATTEVALDPVYFNDPSPQVAVATGPLPVPTAYKTGNQGLLDMAINSAVDQGLRQHLETLPLDEFNHAADKLVAELEQHGFTIMRISDPIDYAELPRAADREKGKEQKDFSSVATTTDADHLLLLTARQAGTIRSYYGFIPTSAPSGHFVCHAKLIDLESGEILWDITRNGEAAIMDPWSQADIGYPNLTNAVYEAMQSCSDQLVGAFRVSRTVAGTE